MPHDLKLFVDVLREEFTKRLEPKTGWGKNKVKEEFEDALIEALMRYGLERSEK